jgi:hypothetical protein
MINLMPRQIVAYLLAFSCMGCLTLCVLHNGSPWMALILGFGVVVLSLPFDEAELDWYLDDDAEQLPAEKDEETNSAP